MKNALKLIAIMLFAWAMASCTKDSNNGGNNGGGNSDGNGTHNGHEYVDLGLPSGTLWATCNVGADKPEDVGDIFAWGDTRPKTSADSTYWWDTYPFSIYTPITPSYVFNTSILTKYCYSPGCGYNGFTDTLTILQPEDDAATANWGSGWRTPTIEEWQELEDHTHRILEYLNGVRCCICEGVNGNKIYLCFGESGYPECDFWSSSLSNYSPLDAYQCVVERSRFFMEKFDRIDGGVVRPVRSAAKH